MKKSFFLFVAFLSFSQTLLSFQEIAVLQLPDHREQNWKEISRALSEKESLIEVIPCNQTIYDWDELICVMHNDISQLGITIDGFIDHLCKTTLNLYPVNSVAWKVIEKCDNGFIYEWFLHERCGEIPVQHEIARVFLTPSDFHRIGFTRRNRHMDAAEREKWIKLLNENASLMHIEDAKKIDGLSLVENLKETVSLGANFQNWKKIFHRSELNGITTYHHIPQEETMESYNECLVTLALPACDIRSVGQFFKEEKNYIRKKAGKHVRFNVLDQSPHEIIYTYCFPVNQQQCSVLVRAFLALNNYYIISHKKYFNPLGIFAADKMKEALESICITP